MVYAATTFKYTFNYTPDDVFFCTADLGWITGHTVNVYGSLANAATIVLFEGTPFYPYPGRLWEIIDKLQVSIFYTAPTAIRSLMKYGDEHVKKYKLDSLKLLGTAGEPINEEAWCWYYKVVGKRRCPIVDTFWQTETVFYKQRFSFIQSNQSNSFFKFLFFLEKLGCTNVDTIAWLYANQTWIGNITIFQYCTGNC